MVVGIILFSSGVVKIAIINSGVILLDVVVYFEVVPCVGVGREGDGMYVICSRVKIA